MHLDREGFHGLRVSFVVLLIEELNFYRNNPIKLMSIHATSVCRHGEKFLQKTYELFDEFSDLLKPNFVGFVSEKFAKVPDEKRFIKQLFLTT